MKKYLLLIIALLMATLSLWAQTTREVPGTYATIQAAIDASVAGDVINVAAGTYAENLTLNKSLDIRGPNYGIDPNASPSLRVAEAIIVPSVQDLSISGQIIYLQASNVSINGFTLDGDNTLISGGTALNGADINTSRGVRLDPAFNTMNHFSFDKNIVKNLTETGVYLNPNTPVPGPIAQSSFNYIRGNLFSNMRYRAIYVQNEIEVFVDHNTLTNVHTGIVIEKYGQAATGGFIPAVSNNTITLASTGYVRRQMGISINNRYTNAVDFGITDNTISVNSTTNTCDAIRITSMTQGAVTTASNNTIIGNANCNTGYFVWNTDSYSNVVIAGGTITGVKDNGILLTDIDLAYNASSYFDGNYVTIDNVSITTETSGTGIKSVWHTTGPQTYTGGPCVMNVQNGTTITGISAIGAYIDGAKARINFVGSSPVSFNGGLSNYISLVNAAATNPATVIDATAVSFATKTGATATITENFAIEDKLLHKMDNTALGLVRVKALELFVTTASGTIQRGIDLSASGEIVNVAAGTYEELIVIDKPITLNGPNATIAGNGIRNPEAIIQFPAGTASGGVLIYAGSNLTGVTISGFDLRCQDATIPNYLYLIYTSKINNLTIRNNRMYSSETPMYILTSNGQNDYRTGLMVEGNYVDCGPNVNNSYNRGIYVQATSGTIQDNQFLNTNTGIQYMPYGHTTPATIQRNTITAGSVGLYHNYQNKGAAQVTWSQNEVSVAPNDRLGLKAQVAGAYTSTMLTFRGMEARTFGTEGSGITPQVYFNNNKVNGNIGSSPYYTSTIGYRTYDASATGITTLTDNSFTNLNMGVVNNSSVSVAATCNWWGTAVPAEIAAKITGSATYIPYSVSDGGACEGAPVVVRRSGSFISSHTTIQAAIAAAQAGDVITVAPGTYVETGQIVISKNLTITGADKATTIIKPAQGTGGSGYMDDNTSWILVNSGVTFNLSNVTLDGTGKTIVNAILSHGHGTIDNNIIKNMQQLSSYDGVGVALLGSDMTVSNNTFSGIGREGVWVVFFSNATITGNTYTGKGSGDWLDYAVEVGRNSTATISGNTFTACTGVASYDGSTSAGIMATSYYDVTGTHTNATITGNTITGNFQGITVGYDANDVSNVSATNNDLSGNTGAAIFTTVAPVTATCNWYGTAVASEVAAKVTGNVTYIPYQVSDGGVCDGGLPVVVTHADASTNGFATIQEAINAVTTMAGDVITVAAGTYIEAGQIVINKNLTIIGADKATTSILPSADFTSNATGWFKINNGVTLNLSKVKLDGTGRLLTNGMLFEGNGVIDDCAFYNIKNGLLEGSAMRIYNSADVDVTNCVFTEIGRNGMRHRGTGNIQGNTYTGKGAGSWLDYFALAEYGCNITINGNTVTNCLGVAYDGSGSAAFAVWDDENTTVSFTNNIMTGNTCGIGFAAINSADPAWEWPHATIGAGNVITGGDEGISFYAYGGATHTPVVTITGTTVFGSAEGLNIGSEVLVDNISVNGNSFSGYSGYGLDNGGTGNLDATCNWWGTADYNTIMAKVHGDVDFVNYLVTDNILTPLCTGGVWPVHNVTQDIYYQAIQPAITAATSDNVIEVAAGTYNEYNINVNKPLTLKGANANVAWGSPARGAESKIQNADGYTLLNVLSDGVTINGFEITGPLSNNGIYNDAGGHSNVSIVFNNIHDIGTLRGTGSIRAIHYMLGLNANSSNVIISDNYLDNIGNTTTLEGSADAIWFGPGTNPGTVTNVNIERNIISNVKSVASGRGSRGILVTTGSGSITNPVIRYNNITNLAGPSAQAIRIDNNTPGALVTNNLINNISSTNNDAAGVYTNLTSGWNTLAINNNSFSNVKYGVQNSNSNTISATCNWYGENFHGINNVSNNLESKISGPVTYSPWLPDGGNSASIGFIPTASCNGTAIAQNRAYENIKCYGEATGSVSVNPTGGVPPYTYLWSNGSTTNAITGLIAGAYSVIITDAVNATMPYGRILTQPSAPLAVVLNNKTDVLCYGQTTGAINVSMSGGTTPYTYAWKKDGANFAAIEDLNSLGAGLYDLTVTDANLCTTVLATVTIAQPDIANGWVRNMTKSGQPYYCTIQAAIDAATAGDVINVGAGTYSEQVNVNKPLTLLGAQANVTPVSGGRSGGESIILGGTNPNVGAGYAYNEIDINADNVEVNGFELSSNRNYGITANNGATGTHQNVTIKYNYVHSANTAFVGIALGLNVGTATFNNYVISHNYISAGGAKSIAFSGGSATVYSNLIFSYNEVTNTGTGSGIFVSSASFTSPVITYNNFHDIPSGDGIHTVGIANGTISHNTMSNCGGSGAWVSMQGGTFTYNTISNCQNSYTLYGNTYGAPVAANVEIAHNSFTYNDNPLRNGTLGLRIPAYTTASDVNVATLNVHDNAFFNASAGPSSGHYAIKNQAVATLPAGNNYFNVCPSVFGPVNYFPYYSTLSGTPGSYVFGGLISNINAEATVPTVCAGSSTTIFATGGSDYLWDNGLGLGSSKVVSPSVNTTYNVAGKDANGCTGAFDDVIIGVNSAPTVTITGPTSANAGALVTLTAGGASTYVWNTGETTAAINVYPTSTTTYSVTGIASGCSGSATHTVTPVSVTAGPNRFVCSGSLTTLTATVVGATPVSYLWTPGGQTTASINITPNTTTVYTVTVTVTGGATPQAQVTVFVNSKPVANAGSDITIAPAGSGTLTGNGSNGIAPYTWAWSGPGIVGLSTTKNITVNAEGDYSLIVTDAFGCVSLADVAHVTVASTGNTVSGNVSYYNALNPQMHNVTVTLKQLGVTKYTAVTPASGDGNYTILGVANGTYDVFFSLPTAWGGVTSADIIAIQNHYKPVGAVPLIGLKRLAADVIDNSTSAIVNLLDRNAVNNKRLYPNNPAYNFATGNWVFVKETDVLNYTTYANSAGTTNIQVTVGTSPVTQNFKSLCYGDVDASYSGYKDEEQIVNMNTNNGLELINFPNPFSKMTTIRYTVPVESKVVIKVHDLLGKQVASINDPDNYEGSHDIFFDAAGLAPGVYLYTVILNTGDDKLIQTGKMIINK